MSNHKLYVCVYMNLSLLSFNRQTLTTLYSTMAPHLPQLLQSYRWWLMSSLLQLYWYISTMMFFSYYGAIVSNPAEVR
jgi:hypothetical protein